MAAGCSFHVKKEATIGDPSTKNDRDESARRPVTTIAAKGPVETLPAKSTANEGRATPNERTRTAGSAPTTTSAPRKRDEQPKGVDPSKYLAKDKKDGRREILLHPSTGKPMDPNQAASDEDTPSENKVPEAREAEGTPQKQPSVLPVPVDPNKVKRKVSVAQIQGGPGKKLQPKSQNAYWVWYAPKTKTWSLRTTATEYHIFRGSVHVFKHKGTIIDVHPRKAEHQDRLDNSKDHIVNFAFRTGPGVDGFDFRTTEGTECVFYRLLVDDKPAKNVLIGKDAKPAPGSTFRVCR